MYCWNKLDGAHFEIRIPADILKQKKSPSLTEIAQKSFQFRNIIMFYIIIQRQRLKKKKNRLTLNMSDRLQTIATFFDKLIM